LFVEEATFKIVVEATVECDIVVFWPAGVFAGVRVVVGTIVIELEVEGACLLVIR